MEERDFEKGSSSDRALPSPRLDPPGGRVKRQSHSTPYHFTLSPRGRAGIEGRDSGEGSSSDRALPSLRLDPRGGRVKRQLRSAPYHFTLSPRGRVGIEERDSGEGSSATVNLVNTRRLHNATFAGAIGDFGSAA
ncbi:hypothetical protein V7x_30390 [Crateriforma conspicua]|uniref:Uncharacterized protein n=1 Tax=Crateriforma conspicua TaxID=2527996 RepID=A0A5C6G0Q2_9PLAN|nr:hypothetical protein V7x_30390 [Crateriforma conspicua]